MSTDPLDNPVWQALTGAQATFAVGDQLARRYRREVTQIGAVAEPTDAAYRALAALADVGESMYLGRLTLDALPDCWAIDHEKPMAQMVLPSPAETPAAHVRPVTLTEADVPEMCELAELTHPGPFGPEVIRLGLYLGVREGGRLVAMAGERMRVAGFCEVSGVCTHPDWQGRGLARALMNHVASRIQRRGDTPFLHVIEENTRAAELYARMGYVTRRRLWARVIRRVA